MSQIFADKLLFLTYILGITLVISFLAAAKEVTKYPKTKSKETKIKIYTR